MDDFKQNIKSKQTKTDYVSIMKKIAEKEEKLKSKRKWCPGCGYPYYKDECPNCGGE